MAWAVVSWALAIRQVIGGPGWSWAGLSLGGKRRPGAACSVSFPGSALLGQFEIHCSAMACPVRANRLAHCSVGQGLWTIR